MAQLRDHDAVVRKNDLLQVDPRLLTVEPGFNLRDLETPAAREKLDALKASIAEVGVLAPLTVRFDAKTETVYLTDGHRRLKVVMELIAEGREIDTVPAVAEPKSVNDAERIARIIDFGSGEPLLPSERAEGIRRLLGHGWDRAKIAKRLGISVSTVANDEETVAFPEAVKQAVRDGSVSIAIARDVVREQGPEKAAETITAARQEAKAAGRDKVQRRNLPTSRPPTSINRDKMSVLVATLKEIALSGDGERDRRQARRVLEMHGFITPSEQPDDFEEAV